MTNISYIFPSYWHVILLLAITLLVLYNIIKLKKWLIIKNTYLDAYVKLIIIGGTKMTTMKILGFFNILFPCLHIKNIILKRYKVRLVINGRKYWWFVKYYDMIQIFMIPPRMDIRGKYEPVMCPADDIFNIMDATSLYLKGRDGKLIKFIAYRPIYKINNLYDEKGTKIGHVSHTYQDSPWNC